MTNYSPDDFAEMMRHSEAVIDTTVNRYEPPAIPAKSAPGATRRKNACDSPYANELDLQEAFITAIKLHVGEYPDLAFIYAIPNQWRPGTRPTPGMLSGWPDHALDVPIEWAPGHWHHGLRLEAKQPGETPSDKQRKVHAWLRSKGYVVVVWDDVDTAVALTLAYMRGELPPF